MTELERHATFVTFYSFKGGVGRSLALINTASILAGRGFHVLAIDCDLEAPGISYLNPAKIEDSTPKEESTHAGFVDLLLDAKERGAEADLFQLSENDLIDKYSQGYLLPKDTGECDDGSLKIMPAGKFDGYYAARLNELSLGELYNQGVGEPLIRTLKKRLVDSRAFDYVLVDSRTGFSDEAGICTRDLADHLIILSGLNQQNVHGTSEFLRTLRNSSAEMKGSIQIVLSPIPNGEDALVDQRIEAASKSFGEAWGEKIALDLEIPYHPQLALTEVPHVFRRRKGYLFEAYQAIEHSLLYALGHTASALTEDARKAIEGDDASKALIALRRAVRLDDASWVADRFLISGGRDNIFKKLTSQNSMREVLELLVDNMSTDMIPWIIDSLKDEKANRDLIDKLYQKSMMANPSRADIVGNYANFLTDICGEHDKAEGYYKQALALDSSDSIVLSNYGAFLTDVRNQHDAAEEHYMRSMDANPNDSNPIGNYANLLLKVRGDYDSAEKYYKMALALDPTNAQILSNYAYFLTDIRNEHDQAEIFYKKSLSINSDNINSLLNYAIFLTEVRGDSDEAEKYYKNSLSIDPDNINSLVNYANFLTKLRNEHDQAEVFYKKSLSIDPDNIRSLLNYAIFLTGVRGDNDEAEKYYQDATAAHPAKASILGQYAIFLSNVRRDYERAEEFYKRALQADPTDANQIGNYGGTLLSVGRIEEGMKFIADSLRSQPDKNEDPLTAECHMYLYCCGSAEDRKASLKELKRLITETDIRTGDWNFGGVIRQAKKMDHTEAEWLEPLAAVLAGTKSAEELAGWEAWQQA